MLSGTTGAYAYPLKKQIPVNASRTLTTQDLQGVLVVNSNAGPVVLTLPFANQVRAGGFFQILALTGNVNPVIVRVQTGDSYNDGETADLTLDQEGQALLVAAQESATTWLIPLSQGLSQASIDWKDSVLAATTVALPANTLNPAANTLTAVANGAFPLIDTVAVPVGEDVLVKNEGGGTDPRNGIFKLTDAGSPTTPWVLTRRDDANTSAKVTAGMVVPVNEGTQAEKAFILATNDPITLNVTPLTFVYFGIQLALIPPPTITDSTNVLGVAGTASRQDHTHAHGSRGGGALHALATVVLAGFMSAADKSKLDSVSPGAGPRLYDAVVDAAGGGDYLLPSAAFTAGAKSVFVRKGVYTETANISIPSNGCMIGECPGSVVINLAGGFQVQLDGSGRQTTAGTISVATNSTAVTGVGTNFTALVAGDHILLGDVFNQIASITDDTNLTLTATYEGQAISGQNMVGQSMLTAAGMENIVVVQAPGTAITLTQTLRCFFQAVAVQACATGGGVPGWLITDSSGVVFRTCAAEENRDVGVRAITSTGLFFIGSFFKNNVSHGGEFNSCRAVIMDGTISTQNGGDGIFVVNQSERIQLLDCVISYNDLVGVDTSPGSRSSIIANSTVAYNGQAGINFDGAADIVEGCLVNDNGGDGISAGDDGVISDCNILNNGGYGITMQQDQDCAVTSNVIRDNTLDGILAGADSTITGNAIHSNGGDGINLTNAADDCVVTCNRVSGNGGNGITIAAAGRRATVIGNNFRGNTGVSISDASPDAIKDTGDAAGNYNQT